MLAELEKEGINHEDAVRGATEKIQSKLNEIEERLGRLLDLHLEKLISAEEFQEKDLELANQKVALKQKLEEVRAQSKSWLEPMREFIIEPNEREEVVKTGDPKKLLSFFKNIGSNFLLQEKNIAISMGATAFFVGAIPPKRRDDQLAERERFELSIRFYPYGGLANRWFRPLTHLSKSKEQANVSNRGSRPLIRSNGCGTNLCLQPLGHLSVC